MSAAALLLAVVIAAPVPAPDPRRVSPADAIGAAPVAPAGSQAAQLPPEEAGSPWRLSIATGVAGRFGGRELEAGQEDARVLLYFAGQADGTWTEGRGRAARARIRLFTGGESDIYVPSDGEAEAAYALGRPEFRFVVARLEVGRHPALAIQVLAQAATLPSFEGSLPLAADTMRVSWSLSPIEAAFVRYRGGAHVPHLPGWPTESDRPVAASAGRLRYTLLLPGAVLLSAQGDLVKAWRKADLLLSAEGGLGHAVLDRTTVFNATVRWNAYTRRGLAPGTSATESELLVLATATLVL
jgi:hypothetical protein